MADLNALYQALRKADAAGDTEGAKRLAQYIQQVQATPAAPVAPPTAPKESTFGSELVRGAKQLVSSARTGVGSVFNPEEAAKAGVARSQAIGEEAGVGPSLEAVQKAYQDKGVLSATVSHGRTYCHAWSVWAVQRAVWFGSRIHKHG